MKFNKKDLECICEIVIAASKAELLPRFRQVTASSKADGSLLTEADMVMQSVIQSALAHTWPEIRLLGEEMTSEEQQQLLADSDSALWCLDPLDGTGNYAAGIPCFAPSLALIVNGQVIAGVVYDPILDECFSALKGQGAWINGETLQPVMQPERLSDAMAMVDLKRLPASMIEALAAHPPYRSQRSFGSVALDWCWVAAGRFHVYIHGGQRLWDYAAGQLICSETNAEGGHLDSFHGEFSELITLEKRIGMAASDKKLLSLWRQWLTNQ